MKTHKTEKRTGDITNVITWDEFIDYGLKHSDNIVDGMPWSFDFAGFAVTNENDRLYIIEGLKNFTPTDLIVEKWNEEYSIIPTTKQEQQDGGEMNLMDFIDSCADLHEYVDGKQIAHRFIKNTVPVIAFNELKERARTYQPTTSEKEITTSIENRIADALCLLNSDLIAGAKITLENILIELEDEYSTTEQPSKFIGAHGSNFAPTTIEKEVICKTCFWYESTNLARPCAACHEKSKHVFDVDINHTTTEQPKPVEEDDQKKRGIYNGYTKKQLINIIISYQNHINKPVEMNAEELKRLRIEISSKIHDIEINQANIDYISKTLKINGDLSVKITDLFMEQYKNQ